MDMWKYASLGSIVTGCKIIQFLIAIKFPDATIKKKVHLH